MGSIWTRPISDELSSRLDHIQKEQQKQREHFKEQEKKNDYPLPERFPQNVELSTQEKRTASLCYRSHITFTSWEDIHGPKDVIANVKKKFIASFKSDQRVNSVLLSGPPGCGKTLLAEGIIAETGAHYLEYVPEQQQEVEQLRNLVSVAQKLRKAAIVLPNIDVYCGSKCGLPALCSELISQWSKVARNSKIILIGTCEEPDAINSSVKTRFVMGFQVSLPDAAMRNTIIKGMMTYSAKNEDINKIAEATKGFSYNGLAKIQDKVKRQYPKNPRTRCDIHHSTKAAEQIQFIIDEVNAFSEAKFSEIEKAVAEHVLCNESKPTGEWKDIGGLKKEIAEIRQILNADCFIPGVLIHGPPGCGKTMIAKALANETGRTLLEVSPAILLGGAEYNPHHSEALFTLAEKLQPTIIIIDEVDVVLATSERASNKDIQGIFKTKMDGLKTDKSIRVLVVGTTNFKDKIEGPLLDRFQRKIYIPKPNGDQRRHIIDIQLLQQQCKMDPNINLDEIVDHTNCFSGRDLFRVIQSAKHLGGDGSISTAMLMEAVEKKKNEEQVSDEDEAFVEDILHPSTVKNLGDIVGMDAIGDLLKQKVIIPLKQSKKARSILLTGPTGCGKTTIATALAATPGVKFLNLRLETLTKTSWAALFSMAKTHTPFILFLDNIESFFEDQRRGMNSQDIGMTL